MWYRASNAWLSSTWYTCLKSPRWKAACTRARWTVWEAAAPSLDGMWVSTASRRPKSCRCIATVSRQSTCHGRTGRGLDRDWRRKLTVTRSRQSTCHGRTRRGLRWRLEMKTQSHGADSSPAADGRDGRLDGDWKGNLTEPQRADLPQTDV